MTTASKKRTVKQTVAQREKVYGSFAEKAEIIQELKAVMQASPNWEELPAAHKEALEMIQSKIGRVLVGDFNHADNFHDIAGYAQLVEDTIDA